VWCYEYTHAFFVVEDPRGGILLWELVVDVESYCGMCRSDDVIMSDGFF